ncbi:MAG: Xaa-Pro peptidase family protein [Candidatus Adiutrix sp.]|jgi:Xaa-Pro aminopeptidase|nr:Xaa-Pro peptidase family protein [Candidatus Adiutrix sp.]
MSALSSPEAGRLARLRRLMSGAGVTAALVTSPANRRYYSGFTAGDVLINESSGALLITRRSQYLLTDSRYTEAAKDEAPLFKVLEYRRGLARELVGLKTLGPTVRLYFEAEFLSASQLFRLQETLGPGRLAPLPINIDAPRAAKSPEEIRLVSKALAITEAAVAALFEKMAPGLTEREAAFFLEAEFRRLGAEGPSFDTIVASGPNAALPHASPGRRKMRAGEMVIVDCGARYRGYCADITRTKILGRPKAWQREIYALVRQAQLRAIEAIAPGVKASDVDKAAREHIARSGYGQFFGHGLGHGVGLAIHEAPSLSARNTGPLSAGNIVTVEPGIYLPGRGGVRLEQLVLVTERGRRLLNRNTDFYEF